MDFDDLVGKARELAGSVADKLQAAAEAAKANLT